MTMTNKPKINIVRMPYYRLNEALPAWKPLHIVVHPDDSVCSKPKVCKMPHEVVVGLYKLRRIERKGNLNTIIAHTCPTRTTCESCDLKSVCPKEGKKP